MECVMKVLQQRLIHTPLYLIFWLLLVLYPIRNTMIRILLIGGFLLILLQLFYKLYTISVRGFQLAMVGSCLTLCLALSISSTKIDREQLSKTYVSNLNEYKDIQYVWGGESKRGVDCSGLMRMALVDALVSSGLQQRNLYLLCLAAEYWLNDLSAKAILNEYDKKTSALFSAKSINDVDHSKLKIGDMAVTTNGVHVLAYIGSQLWIQADPTRHKVTLDHKDNKAPWLGTKVTLVRWTILER